MTVKPSIDVGNVEITLAGEKKVLKPSVYAIRTISRSCDGLGGAIDKAQKLDFDTISLSIAAGLQLTAIGAEGLDEKIYEAGIGNLQNSVLKYLINLYHGGKPPETVEGNAPGSA